MPGPNGSSPAPPWAIRHDESSQAYECFVAYKDLGPSRSHLKAARKVGRSSTMLDRFARRHDWHTRARAWDAEQQRLRETALKKKRDETVQNHLTAANALMAQALTRLRPTPVRDVNGNVVLQPNGEPYLAPADAAELNAAANALDKAIKHQRLALGLPTDLSRQDAYLQEALKRAIATQRGVQAVIEEHLCDDCRAAVGADLVLLAAEQDAIEKEVVAA
jgi:hypothetical protein